MLKLIENDKVFYKRQKACVNKVWKKKAQLLFTTGEKINVFLDDPDLQLPQPTEYPLREGLGIQTNLLDLNGKDSTTAIASSESYVTEKPESTVFNGFDALHKTWLTVTAPQGLTDRGRVYHPSKGWGEILDEEMDEHDISTYLVQWDFPKHQEWCCLVDQSENQPQEQPIEETIVENAIAVPESYVTENPEPIADSALQVLHKTIEEDAITFSESYVTENPEPLSDNLLRLLHKTIKESILELPRESQKHIRDWLVELLDEDGIDWEPPASNSRVLVSRERVGSVVYQQELVKCGKSNCGKCPHGPYWYSYTRVGSKTKSKYIGKKR